VGAPGGGADKTSEAPEMKTTQKKMIAFNIFMTSPY
jgi:hypothetical protein